MYSNLRRCENDKEKEMCQPMNNLRWILPQNEKVEAAPTWEFEINCLYEGTLYSVIYLITSIKVKIESTYILKSYNSFQGTSSHVCVNKKYESGGYYLTFSHWKIKMQCIYTYRSRIICYTKSTLRSTLRHQHHCTYIVLPKLKPRKKSNEGEMCPFIIHVSRRKKWKRKDMFTDKLVILHST